MANDFFSASGNPATASQGSSATIRAEFSSIEDGFDKLPTLTGNGGKVVAVNSGGTALEAIANVPVSKGGTGQTTYTDGQLLIGNSSGNTLAKSTLTAGSNIVITNGNGSITISATGSGGGGVGSVTSVAQSFTGGLISVSGTPITTSGTLALTVAGTSGGIPYFSSASTWASSAALTNNAIMLGGGAGGAPKTTTTGTGVVTALGVNTGTAGAFVVNGGALGTPSSGTLTSCTGLPVSTGISGLGTNVATALAVNVGSSGAFVTNGGALGTPSSGTVTNLTGTASININGTVGATTPTTGAFTTVTASGVFTGPDGSASAPTYSFSSSGNSDNGMYLSAANEVSFANAGTKRITITEDGRFYGTALHNNAGAVTGTTNQYIASGTYTPSIRNGDNVASSTAQVCQWIRVGNVVTVSGGVNIDPTSSATETYFGLSLPISSVFTTFNQAGGSGTTISFMTPLVVFADVINTSPRQVEMRYTAESTLSENISFSFTYVVV